MFTFLALEFGDRFFIGMTRTVEEIKSLKKHKLNSLSILKEIVEVVKLE